MRKATGTDLRFIVGNQVPKCAPKMLKSYSESRSAVVTNTTIEIVVPNAVTGSIYSENGSNFDRLRQVSGAKVVVHEPRLGTNLSIVVIFGTPDKTQVAQS
ncbi:poly(RC)-binding protein [Striga asiatica]|uniref:Poly(RC)-binding protein n=1 Tax=Striga asiatica TaxID=4170 RepID=A0A5A7NYQ9_STRAF|nr:poly(RC)-binding protein [Striga asiatica]